MKFKDRNHRFIEIILNKNIRCNHVFSTKLGGYSTAEMEETREKLLLRYSKYLYRSAKKFNAPGWEDITEDYYDR